MIEAALGKSTPNIIPGILNGIYEAQPTINSGDFNFYNSAGACVRVGNYLYIASGNISSGSSYTLLNYFFRIDLVNFTMTRMANIPKTVSFSSMWHDNGKLYLFGGIPASGVTTAYLCIYDIATNTWTNTGQCSYLRKNCRTFVYNNELFIVGGGLSSGSVYYNIFSCNLTTFALTQYGQLLNQTGGGYIQNEGQGVLIGDKFYFSRGGASTGNAWMVFDITNTRVTVLTPNPASVAGESPVVVNDKIVIRNGNTSFSVYDINTDSWEVIPASDNTSFSSNLQCAFFEFNGNFWMKWLQSNGIELRRLWKVY